MPHILGEELQLPNAATWWCGQDTPRDYVLDHLAELVVKPTFRSRDSAPPRYGAWMGKAARAALANEIRANPTAWCAQERDFPQHPRPAGTRARCGPMPFITRLYVAWHDGDYIVMPGGLTRCNPRGEDMIVSLQQGSVSKDTWVLHEGAPALPPQLVTSRPTETLRHPAATPSRTANNFFWLGRYLERTATLARMLEKLEGLLHDEIALLDPAVPHDTLALIFQLQGVLQPEGATLDELAALARKIADDPGQPSSLAATVANLVRLLEALKVRLPHEAWQMTRHLPPAAQGRRHGRLRLAAPAAHRPRGPDAGNDDARHRLAFPAARPPPRARAATAEPAAEPAAAHAGKTRHGIPAADVAASRRRALHLPSCLPRRSRHDRGDRLAGDLRRQSAQPALPGRRTQPAPRRAARRPRAAQRRGAAPAVAAGARGSPAQRRRATGRQPGRGREAVSRATAVPLAAERRAEPHLFLPCRKPLTCHGYRPASRELGPPWRA
ncbi:MAG: circularly permuted type 2 ATP-grasp protein [Lacunisphaera sp.]